MATVKDFIFVIFIEDVKLYKLAKSQRTVFEIYGPSIFKIFTQLRASTDEIFPKS